MPFPIALNSATNLAEAVMAVGALGTAAFGVVDATKGMGGGVSHAGLIFLKCLIDKVVPVATDSAVPPGSALTNAEIYATIKANWLNGLALSDQKSTLKTLVKLRLNPASAPAMATLTGVDAALLTSLAVKLARGAGLADSGTPDATAMPAQDPNALTAAELDAYGRFDVMLSTSIDRAYNQADQRYRNWAKLLACFVAVVLSIVAMITYLHFSNMTRSTYLYAVLIGLLATPLAPIAKDVSTAINTAAKAVKVVQG